MQAETSPPAFFVSEMSLSISAYCFLFIKNPLPPCGTIRACGYTTQSLNAECVNPAMRRFKFWSFVESRPLPQTGYVSQRIPHGYSKAGVVEPPLPSNRTCDCKSG